MRLFSSFNLASLGLIDLIVSRSSAKTAAADGKFGRILGMRPAGMNLFFAFRIISLKHFSPDITSVGSVIIPNRSSEKEVNPTQSALLKFTYVFLSDSTLLIDR